ncbi:FG-GAP-like repeat-containing protein [Streptomyces sp. ISL-100]|uniref:FG-GAP-like repeat-containing protein n=1 Tax=Streptomyces sp. ISL-100 TaxID=2819173 RepID=UPI001BE5DC2C|nr:FG-GAP-like repeat-containing protein [Streptomyces sp. ISL-100]MBT2399824.1 VCBS repeat-containing protein [Streptomyces sp. ISL-100]
MSGRAFRRTAVTAAVVVSASLLSPTAHAATFAASTLRLQDDFNGDGYHDVVVTAPTATVSGKSGAGYVAVLYGSSSGLNTSRKKVISQDSTGIPGVAESGDSFGSAVSSADLDNDGYADLIVGASGEDVGTVQGAGALAVIWGSASGLSSGSTLLSNTNASQYLGVGVAAGDFNGDGHKDVVTEGDSGLQLLSGPFHRDGSAAKKSMFPDMVPTEGSRSVGRLTAADVDGDGLTDVIGSATWNSEAGAGPPTAVYWRGTASGFADRVLLGVEADDVALGDLNRDGHADLVAGHWSTGYDMDMDPMSKGGMITVVYGSASGPDVGSQVKYNQDSSGIPGAAEAFDSFGRGISVGDINGDGYADATIGVPGEDFNGKTDAGALVALSGSASGLTTSGAKVYHQDTSGIPGTAESADTFGTATKLVDANKDGKADLLVGAPGENSREGGVWVLRGTSTGITTSGSWSFGPGALGTTRANARLGSDFNHF